MSYFLSQIMGYYLLDQIKLLQLANIEDIHPGFFKQEKWGARFQEEGVFFEWIGEKGLVIVGPALLVMNGIVSMSVVPVLKLNKVGA